MAGALAAAGLLVALLSLSPEVTGTVPPYHRPTPGWVVLSHALRSRYRLGGPCVQLQQALWLEGWDGRLIPLVVEIARAESNCQPQATRRTDREFSVGPLQLNLLAHREITVHCARDYGCTARTALLIFHRQGLDAWTVYRNGTYRRP